MNSAALAALARLAGSPGGAAPQTAQAQPPDGTSRLSAKEEALLVALIRKGGESPRIISLGELEEKQGRKNHGPRTY